MSKNSKNILLLLAFFMAIAYSCVREIDFLVDTEGTETLVVDGNFTDQNGPHRVYLTRPNKYAVNSFINVQDAQITIKDDQGNQANYEVAGESGHPYFYQLPVGVFQGVPGRSYHLEIKLADGKTYQSVPQMMPNRVKIDSIPVKGRIETKVSTVDVVVENKTALISAAMTVPNDGKNYYFRWEASAVYIFFELVRPGPLPPPTHTCYIFDDFNNQVLPLQSLKGKNGQSQKVDIGSKLFDKSFDDVQYLTVVQRSLNKESFDYWEKIKKISLPEGTIFDAPPGAVRGNVFNVNDKTETPLGFFEVAAVDTLRKRVNSRDLGDGFLFNNWCTDPYYSPDPPYLVQPLPECYDCQILPNSSLKKPWYWQ
jgi:hypothetical protein